ncbi:hypothetical protein FRC10_001972 [Ceratobasidium sp. 414]|nr:hypothetical protein FRC10_001972 [Ceratobasidium sp. 414]
MSSQAKKRKLVAVGPSGSSSVKKQKIHAKHSPDAQLLTRIVKKTELPILQQTLLSSIPTISPSDLDSLKRILEPLVTAARNPLHCVLCHKSYVEQENTWNSCKIPHLAAWGTDSEPSSDDYDYESDSDGGYDSSGRWKGVHDEVSVLWRAV